MSEIRTFESGATRNVDAGRHDYYGYISYLALSRFAKHMTAHRIQADGSIRDSDNWQKGIPMEAYRSSLARHFHALMVEERYGADSDEWAQYRKDNDIPEGEDTLAALLFNVQGLMHEQERQRAKYE